MAKSVQKSVRGTKDYVIFTDRELGRGAMGNVMIARHRTKGTKYAAKIFNDEARRSHSTYIQRELEILKFIPPHESIVRLEVVQHCKYSSDDVVIMELCQGGSLQQVLDQPENYYGLTEDEFMLVFEHTTNALHHLLKHKVVHRDVKPGNILLSIAADGRHMYKLTDFGASSRWTSDDDTFRSMCGTEEYLHPSIHSSAFVRRVPNNYSGPQVDLWSFAVTLYQCATGMFPYRPHGGIRDDKKTMNRLMTEKASGVISQIQNHDGKFQAFKTFPHTVRLKCGTKSHVTRILAAMMDIEHKLTPDDYYKEMELFFSCKRIQIFSTDLCEMITIYVPPKAKFGEFESLIREELQCARVRARDQMLLIYDGFTVKRSSVISDYTQAEENRSIIYLISNKPSDTDPTTGLPELPDGSGSRDMSGDVTWARTIYGNILYYEYVIRRQSYLQELMTSANRAYGTYYREQRIHLMKKWGEVRSNADRLQRLWPRVSDHFLEHHPVIGQQVADESLLIGRYVSLYKEVQSQCNMLLAEHLDYDVGTGYQMCSRKRCVETAEVTSREATPMFEALMADRKRTDLSHNELELWKYNKSELGKIHKLQHKLVTSHCLQRAKSLCRWVQAYIWQMRSTSLQLEDVAGKLADVAAKQDQCDAAIIKLLTMTSEPPSGYPSTPRDHGQQSVGTLRATMLRPSSKSDKTPPSTSRSTAPSTPAARTKTKQVTEKAKRIEKNKTQKEAAMDVHRKRHVSHDTVEALSRVTLADPDFEDQVSMSGRARLLTKITHKTVQDALRDQRPDADTMMSSLSQGQTKLESDIDNRIHVACSDDDAMRPPWCMFKENARDLEPPTGYALGNITSGFHDDNSPVGGHDIGHVIVDKSLNSSMLATNPDTDKSL